MTQKGIRSRTWLLNADESNAFNQLLNIYDGAGRNCFPNIASQHPENYVEVPTCQRIIVITVAPCFVRHPPPRSAYRRPRLCIPATSTPFDPVHAIFYCIKPISPNVSNLLSRHQFRHPYFSAAIRRRRAVSLTNRSADAVDRNPSSPCTAAPHPFHVVFRFPAVPDAPPARSSTETLPRFDR